MPRTKEEGKPRLRARALCVRIMRRAEPGSRAHPEANKKTERSAPRRNSPQGDARGLLSGPAGPATPGSRGVRVEHVAINNLLRREGRESLQRRALARILPPFPSLRLRLLAFSRPLELRSFTHDVAAEQSIAASRVVFHPAGARDR